MLGGKAEVERLCPVTREQAAGLRDGHCGAWAISVSHAFPLKSPDMTESPSLTSCFQHHLQGCSRVIEHSDFCDSIRSCGP